MIRGSILSILLFSIGTLISSAQTSDFGRLSLSSVVYEEQFPSEIVALLQSKMNEAVSYGGLGGGLQSDRFVFAAKIHMLEKVIMPSTPVRINLKIRLSFAVVDIVDKKLYKTYSVVCSSLAKNENKALISAIENFNPTDKKLQETLDFAKQAIIDYYGSNKERILSSAKALASVEKYDEAINQLLQVPSVSIDCYTECLQLAGDLYKQKIDSEGAKLYNTAVNIWVRKPNAQGAKEILPYINQMNPLCSSYPSLVELRSSIELKLRDDEKLQWELEMKKYDFEIKKHEDSQLFKKSVVEALRDVSIAYFQNRPKTISYDIFNLW